MQPRAWKTLCSFFVAFRRDESSASSSSATAGVVSALHESILRADTANSGHTNTTTGDMMDDFDEDELHAVINDMFARNNSIVGRVTTL